MKKNELASTYLRGYPDYAYPLGIILAEKDGYNWLYENFISVYYDKNDMYNPYRFFYSDHFFCTWNTDFPFINYSRMQYDLIPDISVLNKMIVDTIDRGGFVQIYLNEKYIPNRITYGEEDYNHINLIQGYDDTGYIILGYDDKLQYGESIVPYEVFNESVQHMKDDKNEFWYKKIVFFFKDRDHIEWDFSLERMQQKLKEYLESTNDIISYGNVLYNYQRLTLGMKTYDKLIEYFDDVVINHPEINYVKPLRIMYEHKLLMKDRFIFINEDETASQFNEIANMLNTLLMKIIYLQKKGPDAILSTIKETLTKVKDAETKCLTEYLKKAKVID